MKHLSFLESYMQVLGNHQGLSELEIQQLEKDFNVIFPAAYHEYLLFFGKESGDILGSYYTEVKYLSENKTDVISEVDFVGTSQIKDSYFFFGQWQSYIFYFFDCTANNEDPPVYALKNSGKIELYKPSFSQFVKEEGLDPVIGYL